MTTAIVRRPGLDLGAGLTTVVGSPPELELALAQHRAYIELLADRGLSVVELEPLPGFPDAYFVEDVAVVAEDFAVVTRPGAPERRGEEEAIVPILEKFRPLEHITAPAILDGGDVLRIGDHFLIGVSDRTSEEGVAQLGAILGERGLSWSAMSVGLGLHLKSSVASLGDGTLLVTAEYVNRPELAAWDRLVVEPGEEPAANALWVNGSVILPAGFPRTRERLEARGWSVETVDVSEARKMDGGVSCLSLRF